MEAVERSSILFRAIGLLNSSSPAVKQESVDDHYSNPMESHSTSLSPNRRRRAADLPSDCPVHDAKVPKCGSSSNDERSLKGAPAEDPSTKAFPDYSPELNQALFSNILAALTSGGLMNSFAYSSNDAINHPQNLNGFPGHSNSNAQTPTPLLKPKTSHAIRDILGDEDATNGREEGGKSSSRSSIDFGQSRSPTIEEKKKEEADSKKTSPQTFPPPLMNWGPHPPSLRFPTQEISPDFTSSLKHLGGSGYLPGISPSAFVTEHEMSKAPSGANFFPQKFGMTQVGLPSSHSPNAAYLWMRQSSKFLQCELSRPFISKKQLILRKVLRDAL